MQTVISGLIAVLGEAGERENISVEAKMNEAYSKFTLTFESPRGDVFSAPTVESLLITTSRVISSKYEEFKKSQRKNQDLGKSLDEIISKLNQLGKKKKDAV